MSVAAVIAALEIPDGARVDQRVPKKLLAEEGAPTAVDKRKINEGIEELLWVAALKPTTIGVPEYRDDQREYLEIAVLSATLRAGSQVSRLIELIHRAIPYPVFLVSVCAGGISISLAHKRFSEGQTGKVVIEELRSTPPFHPETPTKDEKAFLASLPISGLPTSSMYTLYQGWLDRLASLAASSITGVYTSPDADNRPQKLHDNLDKHARLTREITALRAQAVKQKQINKLVELNLKIKQLETELAAIANNL